MFPLEVPTETKMTDGTHVYSLPASFEAELVPIYESWRDMRRGDNDVPFWDDVNLPSLGCSGGPSSVQNGEENSATNSNPENSRSPRSAMRRNSPFEGTHLFSTWLDAGLRTNSAAAMEKWTDRDDPRRGGNHGWSRTVPN